MMLFASILSALLALLQVSITTAGEVEFEALIAKMEADVLELAKQVEDLYKSRCFTISLEECYKGNYHNCLSEFPNQQCLSGEDLALAVCGDGQSCSALWDYSVSNVRIPEDLADSELNPSDPQVIETVCFTQKLDEWLVSKYQQDRSYWANIGVRSPQMYFGSHNGANRIYPARQSAECGSYDPRKRPWYIAASSGPKNVILVLDTSGSMKGQRLELMKEAAKQVIRSLTVGDRIAVVQFASEGTLYGDQNQYFYEASDHNKKILIKAIDQFEAVGGTNFQDAFSAAFYVLNNSIKQELHVACNTAILFLTDGEMTEPQGADEAQVLDYITSNLALLKTKLRNHPIFLFTYSISENGDVHSFPKKIACSATNTGVWSKIVDDRQIFDSLTSYFLLFALGLGTDKNSDFTAWVEPYKFATGGIIGTTVSAPVYDRSKSPPHLFLGVVGLDFPLVAVDKALGVEEGSQESIDRIVLTSTAKCPSINLTLCELESFRHRGIAGDEAWCTSSCMGDDFVVIEEESCPLVNDYPDELWKDRSYEALTYVERTCCKIGESGPSDECPADGDDSYTAVIVGVVVGSVAVVLVAAAVFYYSQRLKGNKTGEGSAATASSPGTSTNVEQPLQTYTDPPASTVHTAPVAYYPEPSAPYNPNYVEPESE